MNQRNVLMMAVMLMTGSMVMAQTQKNEKNTESQRPTEEQRTENQAKALANRLMLDEQTSQKFTTVFKKYRAELLALRPAPKEGEAPEAAQGPMRGRRGPGMQGGPGRQAPGSEAPAPGRKYGKAPEKQPQTDAEIESQLKSRWAEMRKLADLQEKYYGEFHKFLTAKQTQFVLEQGNHQGARGFDAFPRMKGRRGGMRGMQPPFPGGPRPDGQPGPEPGTEQL